MGRDYQLARRTQPQRQLRLAASGPWLENGERGTRLAHIGIHANQVGQNLRRGSVRVYVRCVVILDGPLVLVKRGGPIKQKVKRLSAVERAAQQRWSESPEPCVACRATGLLNPGTEPHHAVYRQRLRRYVETQAYEQHLGPGETADLMAEVCYDLRNRAWLCSRHHADHHGGSRYRIPLSALPESVHEFAETLGSSFVDALRTDYA